MFDDFGSVKSVFFIPDFGIGISLFSVFSVFFGTHHYNFPISVNRNSGFFSLSEQKNGPKNEILVDLNLPLISMSFWDSSQQSARLSRNVCVRCRNIHREMNCARCEAFQSAKTCIDSFWVARRIKSYKAFSEPLFEQNFGILK